MTAAWIAVPAALGKTIVSPGKPVVFPGKPVSGTHTLRTSIPQTPDVGKTPGIRCFFMLFWGRMALQFLQTPPVFGSLFCRRWDFGRCNRFLSRGFAPHMPYFLKKMCGFLYIIPFLYQILPRRLSFFSTVRPKAPPVSGFSKGRGKRDRVFAHFCKVSAHGQKRPARRRRLSFATSPRFFPGQPPFLCNILTGRENPLGKL